MYLSGKLKQKKDTIAIRKAIKDKKEELKAVKEVAATAATATAAATAAVAAVAIETKKAELEKAELEKAELKAAVAAAKAAAEAEANLKVVEDYMKSLSIRAKPASSKQIYKVLKITDEFKKNDAYEKINKALDNVGVDKIREVAEIIRGRDKKTKNLNN